MKFGFRSFVILILLATVVGFADFSRWVTRVSQLDAPEAPQADAVIALTGGGGSRIETALSILQAGSGKRLLVSGVHPSVNVETMIRAAGGTQAMYDCCIDFGREADSTEGNAIEAAKWMAENNFHSLVLVTNDYHMPRSRLWFDKKLGNFEIIDYPVASSYQPARWWRSWRSTRALALEWSKYRVTTLMMTFDT
ncbi:MAG: hypothetical protein CMK07_05590 [Ponticaulis sp.]|nr:hypothetical protein [Ponticaulis sp.]